MEAYWLLLISCAAFVGSHFLMSHSFRKTMVSAFGDRGFLGIYSLISLVTFGLMIWAYKQAPAADMLWIASDAVWISASILTLLAAIFYCGSMVRNPALPNPDPNAAAALAVRDPAGMFLVTRHPMMWGFALWGVAHILVAPRLDSFIFNGTIIFLALAGAAGQDSKKAKLMGDAWRQWQSRTSYWPRLSKLPFIGLRIWLAAIALWLVATWAHNFFGPYAAGIYRWL